MIVPFFHALSGRVLKKDHLERGAFHVFVEYFYDCPTMKRKPKFYESVVFFSELKCGVMWRSVTYRKLF